MALRQSTTPRSWSQKFADAFRGLSRAVRSQSSFAVHLGMAMAVVAAGAVVQVSPVEWCLLVFAIGLVLMVSVPPCAPTTPPDTGASMK
jgi:diacylglycerol kinase